MARSAEAWAMIDYVRKNLLMDASEEIGEETPLVSSGLIDSFALIEVLQQLEKVTRRKISPGKVGPNDMDTVSLMLKTADRVGIPR
jgi:acyl carrier protein